MGVIELRPLAELGGADIGWLRAKHHFAFAGHGDPAHGPLGALVVWNDDEIAPKTGFPFHAHVDMEIITYVRQGAITHTDSLGNRGRTEAGSVQVMSAGTGIRHSEVNDEEGVTRIFQIWLTPRDKGGAPRWAAKPFPRDKDSGQLEILASGFQGDAQALSVRADARVLGAKLKPGDVLQHSLEPGRSAYLVAASGRIALNGLALNAGDGAAIRQETALRIVAFEKAELLLVDVA
jgi:redox-sensitive bicupin YhaK (pirin superfamily)